MDSQHCAWNLTTTTDFALFLPLIFFFFFFFFFFFLLIKIKSKPLFVNLPPGPPTLPLIGNLHQLSSIPFRSFRDLAKVYGPIMHLQLGEVPLIVISSPEIAKKILKDNDPKFAGRPEATAIKIIWYNYSSIAFSPYGDYWRQMRKIIIIELLSPKMVRSFGSIRDDEVTHLIKSLHLSSGTSINLTKKIFSMSSSITCRSAFGKVWKDNNSLITLMKNVVEKSSGFLLADFFPSSKIIDVLSWPTKRRLLLTRRKLDMILDDIINQHKRNLANMESQSGSGEFGNEDVVDVLLRIKETGELQFPIGNDNIKAILFDIFAGGTDTSSTVIEWIMTELMRNPHVMAKVQAEVRQVFKRSNNIEERDVQKLKYLKLVIKEALRLHPPAAIIPRSSREECEINGYTIPTKVKIVVNNWAIQRDPRYWTDPETFKPERFENLSIDFMGDDFEYIPFGSGKRRCPGMTFGLASIELPLAQLLYNFNWKLPDGVKPQSLNMAECFGLTASRKENLFVVATPYQPSI